MPQLKYSRLNAVAIRFSGTFRFGRFDRHKDDDFSFYVLTSCSGILSDYFITS